VSEFVDYAKELMESAKGFAEKGRAATEPPLQQAYFRAALLHGFSFLEAHLNELADHFRGKKTLSVHDLGILLEREVRLEKGVFKLGSAAKFSRITDRIEVLLVNFSSDIAAVKNGWFSNLAEALLSRNKLVHPKEIHELSHAEVMRAIKSIIDCIDALFYAVFKKGLPYKSKSLESGYSF
jgi:hypothetical protein